MHNQHFAYPPDVSEALVASMSAPRFGRYLEAAGTPERAWRLYAWNTAVSAAFYGPLQTLEITLRNGIDRALSMRYGSRWFDEHRLLRPNDRRTVAEATRQLHDWGKKPTAGRVLANLPFGFWVGLFATGYDGTLWRTDLHAIFPPKVRHRQKLFADLDRLRTLRNRIAHHEPVFQRHLQADYRQILVITGAISAEARAWVEHHSRVPGVLGSTPDQLAAF